MTTLPAGLSRPEFDRLIAAFVDALGVESVIADATRLREYRDPYTYRESDEFDAAAVVTPTTTEQVQAVVRIANRFGVHLWTISQGRNNTYGGPAPRLRGCVIVSLREMNKVVEIDDELAYAVVEPGVRWFDLYEALQASGGRLWSSIPDLGWGSVVGNSLDYGVGYSPNGDHASQLCGMEVVLPDGSVLHTGMGAATGNANWHTYPHAFGPSLEGLFKQSNFGIVTKVGVWLMRRPQRYTVCWVRFVGLDRLEHVVEALRSLMHEGVVLNLPMLNRGLEVDEHGMSVVVPGSDAWSGRFALYGRATMIDTAYAIIEEEFAGIDGVQLIRRDFDGTDHSGPSNHDERVQRGIPDMDLLDPNMLPFGADTAHLDLSPIGTARGTDTVRLQKLMDDLYSRHHRASVGGILLNKRHALHVSTTFYDPRDPAEAAAVFEAYGQMVDELAEAGYLPYRTNLQNMDRVANKFDFGGGAQLRFVETLKDAIDPNGVLAPGKSGIWPRALRQDQAVPEEKGAV
jgi:FAD/FMN-containing dehydrogenase